MMLSLGRNEKTEACKLEKTSEMTQPTLNDEGYLE